MEIALQTFMVLLVVAGFALMGNMKAGLLVGGMLGTLAIIGNNIDAIVAIVSK